MVGLARRHLGGSDGREFNSRNELSPQGQNMPDPPHQRKDNPTLLLATAGTPSKSEVKIERANSSESATQKRALVEFRQVEKRDSSLAASKRRKTCSSQSTVASEGAQFGRQNGTCSRKEEKKKDDEDTVFYKRLYPEGRPVEKVPLHVVMGYVTLPLLTEGRLPLCDLANDIVKNGQKEAVILHVVRLKGTSIAFGYVLEGTRRCFAMQLMSLEHVRARCCYMGDLEQHKITSEYRRLPEPLLADHVGYVQRNIPPSKLGLGSS